MELANIYFAALGIGRVIARQFVTMGDKEVVNAVLFQTSDTASFVQGENLICDSGMLMNG